jgi:choline dehydrogenase-like flavoprotein
MKKYRYVASMEVAIRDEAVGQLSVDKNGKLHVKKDLTDIDFQKVKGGLDLVRELFQSVGGKDIEACSQVFGLHLMGGCPIGINAKKSVVGPDFRVHGYSRIFVADSSIFPSAPGINPSFTIMALSQKASQLMTRDA